VVIALRSRMGAIVLLKGVLLALSAFGFCWRQCIYNGVTSPILRTLSLVSLSV
jgi:hypothetical protein